MFYSTLDSVRYVWCEHFSHHYTKVLQLLIRNFDCKRERITGHHSLNCPSQYHGEFSDHKHITLRVEWQRAAILLTSVLRPIIATWQLCLTRLQ